MTRLRVLADADHLPALDQRFALRRPAHGPNESSVAKAFDEFDDAGRMKPSPYSERKASGVLDPARDLSAIAVCPQAVQS